MSMRKERKSLVLDIVGFQGLGPIIFEYNRMREVQRNVTFRFYGKNKRYRFERRRNNGQHQT